MSFTVDELRMLHELLNPNSEPVLQPAPIRIEPPVFIKWKYHSRFPPIPTLQSAILIEAPVDVRKQKVARWLKKRRLRCLTKRILYKSRQTVALTRPRNHGRFIAFKF